MTVRLKHPRVARLAWLAAVLAAMVLAPAGSGGQQDRKPIDGPASAELRALVAADQADRQFAHPPTPEQWKPISERDAQRRGRALELLKRDRLRIGEDFDNAALLFQHGSTMDDFLAAHELAAIAFMLRRYSSLSVLAEDRFLKTAGRRQRFGSQFSYDTSGKTILDPVDTDGRYAVTDALRNDLFSPTLEESRRDGPQAGMKDFAAIIARVEQRADRSWLRTARARPEAKELAALAEAPSATGLDRAMALYRSDDLRAPEDYYNAARILFAAGDKSSLLAHELSLVAMTRGVRPARRLFAQTLDAYLVATGLPPRYATVRASAAHAPASNTLTRAVQKWLDLGHG